MAQPVIDIEGLEFSWPGAPPLLDIETFSLKRGESCFLRGASGSGKSTFLGLIAGVLEAHSGQTRVLGNDMVSLTGAQRDRVRADHLGVIFQLFNLVPYLSVIQNVALPCRFSKRRSEQVKDAGGVEAEARRLLQRLGLSGDEIVNRRVTELSVGQQQRVAAARALIGAPSLIIADEPTSALDADTRDLFIQLLSEEAERSGASLLFVSHDGALGSHFDKAVDLDDLNKASQAAEAA